MRLVSCDGDNRWADPKRIQTFHWTGRRGLAHQVTPRERSTDLMPVEELRGTDQCGYSPWNHRWCRVEHTTDRDGRRLFWWGRNGCLNPKI